MKYRRLPEYVMAKQLISPYLAGASSANVEASANATNPVIDGYDGAMFVLNLGLMPEDDTLDVAIEWASSGSATDLAEITAATDAFFAQMDTDSSSNVFLLNLDFRMAGMDKGVIGAGATVSDTDIVYSVTAFLYGGTRRVPVTQDQTIVYAG